MITFDPPKDRIVAIPEEASRQSESGVSMLKGTSGEQPRMARVIAVGPDVDRAKIGDLFIFEAFGASEIELEKKKYIIIREEFVDTYLVDKITSLEEEKK